MSEPARSGASGLTGPVARGVAAAAVTVAAAALLGEERGLELLAVLLAFAAAVYVGAGLQGRDPARTRIEWAVALGFTAIAVAGIWVTPALLAAGWIAHGAWDLSHHRRGSPRGARWYPSTCLAYDWVVGAYVIFLVIA